MEYPYQVFNPSGQLVLAAPESCRYSPLIEYDLLEAGYAITLHGKPITKADVKKRRNKKCKNTM